MIIKVLDLDLDFCSGINIMQLTLCSWNYIGSRPTYIYENSEKIHTHTFMYTYAFLCLLIYICLFILSSISKLKL